MKIHFRDKSHKCNQCDFGYLIGQTHLKNHPEEKLHKCNQCDFESTQAGNFRRHLKTHPEEKSQLNKKEHFSQIENWIMTAIVFLWKNLKIGPLGGAHVNFNNARNRCLQGYPLHVSNAITIYIL